MTMLMHTSGPLERASYPSARRHTAGTGKARAHLAAVGRFCIAALTVVAAGGLLIAIMALKVIVYLPRFHY
jgi:hypothetical protein